MQRMTQHGQSAPPPALTLLRAICLTILWAVPALAEEPDGDPPVRRWVYMQTNLQVAENVDRAVDVLQRAKAAGYNPGGRNKEGRIKLEATKKPKRMDATSTGEDVMLGIYGLEAGRYKVCFAPAGKPRPSAFTSKPGSGYILQVWQRKNNRVSYLATVSPGPCYARRGARESPP